MLACFYLTHRHSGEYLIKQKRVEISKHDGNIIMFKTWHIDIKLPCWYKSFCACAECTDAVIWQFHSHCLLWHSRSEGRKIFLHVIRGGEGCWIATCKKLKFKNFTLYSGCPHRLRNKADKTSLEIQMHIWSDDTRMNLSEWSGDFSV